MFNGQCPGLDCSSHPIFNRSIRTAGSDFIRRLLLLVTETFVLGLVSPGEGSTIVRYRAHSRRVFTKHDHRLRTLSLILQKKIGGIYNVQGGSSTPQRCVCTMFRTSTRSLRGNRLSSALSYCAPLASLLSPAFGYVMQSGRSQIIPSRRCPPPRYLSVRRQTRGLSNYPSRRP